MPSEKPITVVIPLAPTHAPFLPQVVNQLIDDRHLIRSVIVASSSTGKRALKELERSGRQIQEQCGIPIQIVPTRRQQLAGENRNRGWDIVETQYTAFLDADDLYAPRRLTSLFEVIESKSPDLVLHGFRITDAKVRDLVFDDWSLDDVIGPEALYAETFKSGRIRRNEGKHPGDTNIVVPSSRGGLLNVCHGHIVVRTSLRDTHRYGTLYPGEDGQFCRDVLWSQNRVVYVPAQLSIYRPDLSAERSAGVLLRGRRRLARIGRKISPH